MSSHSTIGDAPAEVTIRTATGSKTVLGQLSHLGQTAAAVRIDCRQVNWGRELQPSFIDLCQPDLQVAVVIKGDAEQVVDIVPAAVVEVLAREDPFLYLSLEFARDVKVPEKRSTVRQACNLDVMFRPVIFNHRRLPTTGKYVRGHIVDLSADGARLTTSLRLPITLKVELWFRVSTKQVRVFADIVNEQSGAGRYQYGLSFTRLQQENPRKRRDEDARSSKRRTI